MQKQIVTDQLQCSPRKSPRPSSSQPPVIPASQPKAKLESSQRPESNPVLNQQPSLQTSPPNSCQLAVGTNVSGVEAASGLLSPSMKATHSPLKHHRAVAASTNCSPPTNIGGRSRNNANDYTVKQFFSPYQYQCLVIYYSFSNKGSFANNL